MGKNAHRIKRIHINILSISFWDLSMKWVVPEIIWIGLVHIPTPITSEKSIERIA